MISLLIFRVPLSSGLFIIPKVRFLLNLDQGNSNIGILDDVSEVLTGFYRVGTISGDSDVLKFYGDDGEVHEYSGNFDVEAIVSWVLDRTNAVLEARSRVAN